MKLGAVSLCDAERVASEIRGFLREEWDIAHAPWKPRRTDAVRNKSWVSGSDMDSRKADQNRLGDEVP
jgi:hypothetical protein